MALVLMLFGIVAWGVGFGFGWASRTTASMVAARRKQQEIHLLQAQNRRIARLCRQQMDVEPTLAGLVLDQMDNTEREIER